MPHKTEALIKLLAKIEAGEPYETMGHTQMCQKAFPNPEDFDGSREAYAKSAAQQVILVWRNGSLDAAKALHESVLPEFPVSLTDMTPDYLGAHGWQIKINWPHMEWKRTFTGSGPYSHTTYSDNPAHAWLIAILKALIAEATS